MLHWYRVYDKVWIEHIVCPDNDTAKGTAQNNIPFLLLFNSEHTHTCKITVNDWIHCIRVRTVYAILNAGASMFVLDYVIKQYEFNLHD